MRKIAPITLALALLLTGCTSGIPSEPPAPTPGSSSATPSAESTPAPQIIAPIFTPEAAIEALPWVSTYTVYENDAIPTDPETPFRSQVASLPQGADFALAYTKPGGEAFAKIGAQELSDPTALPVIHREPGWVMVLIPGRLNLPGEGPVNGAAAWIPESQVELTAQATQVVVDLDASTVTVSEETEIVAEYPIILDGGDLTASGTRGFAVSAYFTADGEECSSEKVLAVSTQSEKYAAFADGASIQAIHGWSADCRARSLQTTRTSGCINLADKNMSDLLARVKPGTPVTFKGGTK